MRALIFSMFFPVLAVAEQVQPQRAQLAIKDVEAFNRQALALKLKDSRDFYRRQLAKSDLKIARIQAVAEQQGYASHLFRILSDENPAGGGFVIFGPIGSGVLLYINRKQIHRIGLVIGAVGVSEEAIAFDTFASESLKDVFKLRRLSVDELKAELQKAIDAKSEAERELKELEEKIRPFEPKPVASDSMSWYL